MLGQLRTGWSLRSGEISTASGTWPVGRRGRRQVVAGDKDQPQLTIERRPSLHRATFHRGEGRIELRLTAPLARHCRVDVTGDWPGRDRDVLTALFTMLVRRRWAIILLSGGTH